MKILAIVILILYALSMSVILVYSLIQLSLARAYAKRKKEVPLVPGYYPKVLVQLPVYNERYVIQRLIDRVAAIDYPTDKLEIQVLDDSNDETTEIAKERVAHYKSAGLNISLVRREDRTGYKAGALNYGMERSDAALIAIFDADFLPKQDFLQKTVAYFDDKRLGAVQSRWEHINEDYNLMTQLQAFVLNAHFSVEQGGRDSAGHYINFNGTAGVWRREAIESSGGWQWDTLTEDLDLSYRAQLNGWKLKFLEDIGSPAELPVEMNALRTQQFRWNKGAAECFKKNILSVWRKDGIAFSQKLHAAAHMLNSSLFLAVLMIALLSVPSIWALSSFQDLGLLYRGGSVFLIGVVFLSYFYWLSFKRFDSEASILAFMKRFVLFLAFSLGLSLHNGLAVLEAYLGIKTPFLRTPKFNISKKHEDYQSNTYIQSSTPLTAYLELSLILYFIGGLVYSIYTGTYGYIPFLSLLIIGYSVVAFYSFKGLFKPQKALVDHQLFS